MKYVSWLMISLTLWLGCSLQTYAQDVEPHIKDHYVVATTADDFVAGVLFDAIGAKYGFNVTYKTYPTFGDVLDAVVKGDADFAPNATYTPARAEQLFYSSPTNIEYTYLFSQRRLKLKDTQSLAVPAKTVFHELITTNFPNIKLYEYTDVQQTLLKVKRGEIQGIVAPINYLTGFVKYGLHAELLNNQISIKPVSIVSRLGTDARILEEFVEYVHSEKIQRLLHQSVTEFQRNIRIEALRQDVKNSGLDLSKPLKVKLEKLVSYVKYENNTTKGITSDALFAACDILGIECELTSNADETWEQMHHAFLHEEVDILAPFSVSEGRKAYVHFSSPHHESSSVLVKRIGYKDNVYQYVAELLSERIGVVKEDFSVTKISKLLPQKELISYRSQREMIRGLVSGEVDYIALDRTTLNRVLRDDPTLRIEEDTSVGEVYVSRVAFGFNHNERGRQLSCFFTNALDLIDLDEIVGKYDATPEWRTLLDAEKQYTMNMAVLFVIFVSILLSGIGILHVQSNTDKLTGLKNRRALSRAYRSGLTQGTQVLYLDVNEFKQINDQYGHAVGDLVLKRISDNIKEVWKGQAYRIGGDEFVLTGVCQASQLELIKQELGCVEVRTMLDEPSILHVRLSIGIATSSFTGADFQTILKDADQDMYNAKKQWATS